MSILTKILESTYPLRMKISKITGLGIRTYENKKEINAPVSFYSLQATLNNGETVSMEKYKGNKILIVNLASRCGYTRQYQTLERLYRQNKQLIILGFPSNNFGGQEPGSDEDIASFCKVNFEVSFPVFKKEDVTGTNQQSVYAWLSDQHKNGWNDVAPQWNFYKYLVNENGDLRGVFSSSVSPEDIQF